MKKIEKKRFVVESVSTFYEVHLVEAENEEEAKFIAQHSDYNASKWLGQQFASVSEFDKRDLPRLKQVDSYFFEAVAAIDNKGYLFYTDFKGKDLNKNMPREHIGDLK
jgi:hypothetical protein